VTGLLVSFLSRKVTTYISLGCDSTRLADTTGTRRIKLEYNCVGLCLRPRRPIVLLPFPGRGEVLLSSSTWLTWGSDYSGRSMIDQNTTEYRSSMLKHIQLYTDEQSRGTSTNDRAIMKRFLSTSFLWRRTEQMGTKGRVRYNARVQNTPMLARSLPPVTSFCLLEVITVM
jgi:hypothetical protein